MNADTQLMHYLQEQTRLSCDRIRELHTRSDRDGYKVYDIRQGKHGKKRTIEEPVPDLKKIQRALIPIFEEYEPSPWCTSVRGSSAVENAQLHVGAKHILRVDIKKCYPSIRRSHILLGMKRRATEVSEHLHKQNAIYLCLILKDLWWKDKVAGQVLPTGAPTSPILCNIALSILDYQIADMLKKDYPEKYIYSRYLDDMIVSTKETKRDWEIKDKIERIIVDFNLLPNKKKTRWMDARDDSMIVTGVFVHEDKRGVPRTFWRNMRSRLQHIAQDKREIDPETQGCLAYIKSVDPERHQSLLEYFERRQSYETTTQRRTSPE